MCAILHEPLLGRGFCTEPFGVKWIVILGMVHNRAVGILIVIRVTVRQVRIVPVSIVTTLATTLATTPTTTIAVTTLAIRNSQHVEDN